MELLEEPGKTEGVTGNGIFMNEESYSISPIQFPTSKEESLAQDGPKHLPLPRPKVSIEVGADQLKRRRIAEG